MVVEDSQADLFLIREAITASNVDAVVHVVHDGHQGIDFIDKADDAMGPRPDLVLLDLNLPRKNGAEVLRHLRSSSSCKNALVLIVSSSDSRSDREGVNSLGINGYFRKPSAYEEFMKLGPMVGELLTAAESGDQGAAESGDQGAAESGDQGNE